VHVAEAVVDVGIPTRGEPRFLAQAIESVLAQTRTDWRLVISENGPGGSATEELVQRYLDDSRVSYSPTGVEVSQAANHTRIVQLARAPYIGILHDDDWWGPTFLESRVKFFEQHPDCAIVFAGSHIVDEQGREIGLSRLPFRPGKVTSAKFVPAVFKRNFIVFPSVLVRRSAYEAVGPAYSETVTWIDQEMWLRLGSRFPVGVIEKWDSYYRLHARQLSGGHKRDLGAKHLEVVDAMEGIPGVTPAARRSARALALLHCSLDDIEAGERRNGSRHLVAALRADPTFVRNRYEVGGVLLATAGIMLGPLGQRLVTRSRQRRFARRFSSRWQAVRSRLGHAASSDPRAHGE
jgi:glycosyltransferase involved in cell wall biosynthesis